MERRFMGVDLQVSHRTGRRCGAVSTAREDGGNRVVGRLVRHQVEPGSNDPIGVAVHGHAIRPSGTTGAASASMAARSVRVA